MTNTRNPVGHDGFSSIRRWRRVFTAGTGIAWLACAIVANVAAAPAVGESWAYRVANGYSKEVRGRIEYRVDKVAADNITVLVTPDVPALGRQHVEVYTPEGNWLRHTLINHDQPVEYEFAQPYPAYVFPLDTGKSWSLRVYATNPATGRRNSVRVDGEVLGTERVTVPAGAYDTIKVRRRIYAGDFDGPRSETNVTEIDWYAPALGRAVRSETNSRYMDQNQCGDQMSACGPVRGDWNILELVEVAAPASR